MSDSQAAITKITKPLYKQKYNPFILFIRNLLQYLLYFHNCETDFIWVLGHVGIQGNEFADNLTRSTSVSARFFSLRSHSDFFDQQKENHTKTWITNFNSNISQNSV